MGYKCKYNKGNYSYIIELSTEEYEEVLNKKKEIQQKKQELSQLLDMYGKLEPNRVYKRPLDLDLDPEFEN